MEEDPAFYKKFSQMLKDTIQEYEEGRINELEYLNKVKDIQEKVLFRTDSDIPEALNNREVARAFYGIALEELKEKTKAKNELRDWSSEIAIAADDIIQPLIEVDWQNKIDITRRMIHLIGDYLIDELRDKYSISLSFEEIDRIAEQIVEVAKVRYK
jgi:type I restriction enzyme R subunit